MIRAGVPIVVHFPKKDEVPKKPLSPTEAKSIEFIFWVIILVSACVCRYYKDKIDWNESKDIADSLKSK